jgi:uncharacterized protein (UPF0335 family)
MNPGTEQERKERISGMERQLRISGQELDELWMEARIATGQTRAKIHKQISALREKLSASRKEQEALKQGTTNP